MRPFYLLLLFLFITAFLAQSDSSTSDPTNSTDLSNTTSTNNTNSSSNGSLNDSPAATNSTESPASNETSAGISDSGNATNATNATNSTSETTANSSDSTTESAASSNSSDSTTNATESTTNTTDNSSNSSSADSSSANDTDDTSSDNNTAIDDDSDDITNTSDASGSNTSNASASDSSSTSDNSTANTSDTSTANTSDSSDSSTSDSSNSSTSDTSDASSNDGSSSSGNNSIPSDHIELPLNSRITDKITPDDPSVFVQKVKYYSVRIDDPIPGEDLILMVKPMNRLGDPDLFISSSNPSPHSYESSELVCNAFGLDICVFNASRIQPGMIVHVGVSCFQDCEYSLLAEYNSEVFLTLGQEVIVRYYDSASEIAKFYIPGDDSIDQLIIYANLINSQEVNETFHIYVNEGNGIPTSNAYDYVSREVWFDGKGVSIPKNPTYPGMKPLKTDCNYTILLEGPANGIIKLVAQAFPKIRPINLFQEIRDLVDYKATQTYKLVIAPEELSGMGDDALIVELRVFSGDADLYVHFDSIPDGLTGYQWNSTETGNEAISISKYERTVAGATSGVFYITVYGKFDTGYILDVYYTAKNEDFLLFGETMTGTVITGEVMNYRLNLFGDGEANVTLELNSETGNADLFVKRCSSLEKAECRIQKKDVQSPGSNMMFSNRPKGIDTVKFFFNHSDCNIQVETAEYGIVNICTYQVGVFGNSTNNFSHYSLLAKHSQKHIILKEDEAYRGFLDINEHEYFKFTLPSSGSLSIDEVSFTIDCISGDLAVYASRTARYPNNTNYEKVSYFELDYVDYHSNVDGALGGHFYITVEAFSSADYIIRPVVHRSEVNPNNTDDKQNIVKFTRLVEDQPIKKTYHKRTFKSYFKLKAHFDASIPKEDRSILLTVRPLSGRFKIFVTSYDRTPTETDYDFEVYDNELMFDQITNDTVKIKILVVLDPDCEDLSFYSYEIYYATSSAIIPLDFRPHFDTLSEDQIKFFSIPFDPNGPDFVITKTTYTTIANKNLMLYVSLDQHNPYPDALYYDFNLTSVDRVAGNISSLVISQGNLSEFCPLRPCTMYISVQSSLSTMFSLLVRQKTVPILLQDGIMNSVQLPKQNDTLQFYYFTPNNETVTIFVDSFYVSLETFVNIKELANADTSTWEYPSEYSYDYSYNTSYYSPGSIILKKGLFKRCKDLQYGCALLITIKRNEALLNSDSTIQDVFDIEITSKVTMLPEAKPMVGYVERHMIKYYSIYVSKPDCVLLISVTPTGDGDPDLVVSKGKDSRPTLEKHKWISNAYKGDQLQITKEENSTMNGTYIVGVYGFTNTTFTITYAYENQTIMPIRVGYPVDINLKAGEYQLLEYYNSHEEFRVILNENYGAGEILINAMNNTIDFISQIPDIHKQSQWSTFSNNRDISYISKDDPGYCNYCNYIMAIYAEQDSKFQVTISNDYDPIHLQSGQPLNDYIDAGCKNLYYYQTGTETVTMGVLNFAGEIEIYISNSTSVSETEYIQKFTKSDFKAGRLEITLGKGENIVPFFGEGESDQSGSEIFRHSILVKGVKETNYSLVVSNTREKKIIRLGVADYATISPLDFQEYLFYGQKDQIFSLLLAIGSQSELISDHSDAELNANVSSEYALPRIEVIEKNKHGDTKKPLFVKNITTKDSIFYQIKADKANYHINISNPNSFAPLKYNLMVNSDDVELIIPGGSTMQSLKMGQTSKYELYSPEKKKVFIEIFECLGKVELQGTQKYPNMLQGQYDWEFEYPYENNHIIAFYEVEPGPVFIGVTAIEGFTSENNNSKIEKSEEALYVMKTHLLPPKGKIPQEKFFAGGDGILNYKNEFMNNKVRVTFKGVECANKCQGETSFLPVQYVYYLHVSTDQTILTSFSRCNMNDDAFALFKLSQQNSTTLYYERYVQVYGGNDQPGLIDFDFELPQSVKGAYFVNVVAEIWIYDSSNNFFEEFTIVYNPQQIYASQTRPATEVAGIRLLWIMIAVGVAFLFTIACCCYYRRRTKKFEKRLKYELSDIRNVAGGEIFEDKKAGDKPGEMPIHYKGFLEEKGQEDEK